MMSQFLLSNVNLKERMMRSSRGSVSGQSHSDQNAFVYAFSQIALLGSEADMVEEVDKIFDFFEMVLIEPECLITACALAHVKNGRLECAVTMLERILTKKPDYEPAQVAIAGVWVLQKKQGWVPIIKRLLSTSLDPLVRRVSGKIFESNPI